MQTPQKYYAHIIARHNVYSPSADADLPHRTGGCRREVLAFRDGPDSLRGHPPPQVAAADANTMPVAVPVGEQLPGTVRAADRADADQIVGAKVVARAERALLSHCNHRHHVFKTTYEGEVPVISLLRPRVARNRRAIGDQDAEQRRRTRPATQLRPGEALSSRARRQEPRSTRADASRSRLLRKRRRLLCEVVYPSVLVPNVMLMTESDSQPEQKKGFTRPRPWKFHRCLRVGGLPLR